MKLELSIADDRELRLFIKDLIKSEIVSIARGEVKGILADVIKEGYIPKNQEDIDKVVKNEIHEIIKSELGTWSSYSDNKLKQMAREEISLVFKEALKNGKFL
jgi:hypothetical protein